MRNFKQLFRGLAEFVYLDLHGGALNGVVDADGVQVSFIAHRVEEVVGGLRNLDLTLQFVRQPPVALLNQTIDNALRLEDTKLEMTNVNKNVTLTLNNNTISGPSTNAQRPQQKQ